MNNFKIQFLVLALCVMIPIISGAQYKSQLEEPPTMEEAIKFTGEDDGMDLNLFDPDRFFMNQSYSMSMGFSGGRSNSIALYRNNMSYIISEQLLINAEIGLMHDPLKLGNMPAEQDLSNNIMFGADLLYKPTDNTKFKISFKRYPAYNRYNNYGRYSNYGYGYDNWRY